MMVKMWLICKAVRMNLVIPTILIISVLSVTVQYTSGYHWYDYP